MDFEKTRQQLPSTDPQILNESWWREHPMAYDWDLRHTTQEGSREYFEEIDRRFFTLIEHVAHPGWPATAPFHSLEDFTKLRGRKVLEVGCGAGSAAEVLSRCGCELTAIDLTQRAVNLTSRRLTEARLAGLVIKMDAEKMEFPDESFDYAWCWGVIHHSAHPECIVKELYRVLRPGGRFGAMIYHRNSTRYWVSGVLRRGILGLQLLRKSAGQIQMDFTDGFYARHYSRGEARKLFSAFRLDRALTFDMNDLAIPFRPLRQFVRKAAGDENYWNIVRWVEAKVGWALFITGSRPA
jgi:ubiquinone/menaquinone biosynthesis C-methylase UbiE